MRKREIIEREKEDLKVRLEKAIDASIKIEKDYEEIANDLQERLKELDAEARYDDTLDGQITSAEAKVVMEINSMLDELTLQTGITYLRIDFIPVA